MAQATGIEQPQPAPAVRTLSSRRGASPGRGLPGLRPRAVLTLAPHRTLPLGEADVAVIAQNSMGWCVMTAQALEVTRQRLAGGDVTLANAGDIATDLHSLWNSGLLLANGAAHPMSEYPAFDYPHSLMIKMTGACNYACTYCYDYDIVRFRARVEIERAKTVIESLIPRVPVLELAFHGGEPLLRLEAIRGIVDYVVASGWEARVKFYITTNGSRLDAAARDFLEEHNFEVGISCDGNTGDANALRVTRRAPSPDEVLIRLLKEAPEFIRERCHVLAVVSRTSAPFLTDYLLWLQDQQVRSVKTLFLFAGGRGVQEGEQGLLPDEAVGLFRDIVGLIRNGSIAALKYSDLISWMTRMFDLRPFRACPHGRCPAAGETACLDADGSLRTCELLYHPFFHLGSATEPIRDGHLLPVRMAIGQRSDELRDGDTACGTCALFGLCGGTCPAMAISEHGVSNAVYSIECALNRYLFPELLTEFAAGGGPLFAYFTQHTGANI